MIGADMEEWFLLKSLAQVKAVADPLRQRILEVLRDEPMTTKQVALKLREKPTKLYHHVEILEQAGLIRLVRTKPNRGTVEKYFQVVARHFQVDRQLFAGRPQTEEAIQIIEGVFTGALQATEIELRESLAARLIQPGDKDERPQLSRLAVRGAARRSTGSGPSSSSSSKNSRPAAARRARLLTV
ncbi:MAG: ArsR/SmtB family transcription factor [Gammaproteobacteria bacterium]